MSPFAPESTGWRDSGHSQWRMDLHAHIYNDSALHAAHIHAQQRCRGALNLGCGIDSRLRCSSRLHGTSVVLSLQVVRANARLGVNLGLAGPQLRTANAAPRVCHHTTKCKRQATQQCSGLRAAGRNSRSGTACTLPGSPDEGPRYHEAKNSRHARQHGSLLWV